MKRRAFVSAVAATPFAQLAFGNAAQALAAGGGMSGPTTAAEQKPFIAIAKAKGAKITFDGMGVTQGSHAAKLSAGYTGGVHLDMNMVHASIDNALTRAKAFGKETLAAKLQRLATTGTAAQKTDFVMGSGAKYYFPHDIENAVARSASDDTVQCLVCNPVCYLVCTCQGNGDQVCKDRCRQVCEKYC